MAFSLKTESTATGVRWHSCRPQLSHLSSASFRRSSVHRPKTAYPRFSGVVSGLRYYDPASTKWLSNDPLQEQAGPNLSSFCGNDPVNNVDPLGLSAKGELLGYVVKRVAGKLIKVSTIVSESQAARLWARGADILFVK
ncbi:MAG: RHS repeat-associated core domain-containing protein, partial [bacterium]